MEKAKPPSNDKPSGVSDSVNDLPIPSGAHRGTWCTCTTLRHGFSGSCMFLPLATGAYTASVTATSLLRHGPGVMVRSDKGVP
jgi:hypothetical protein